MAKDLESLGQITVMQKFAMRWYLPTIWMKPNRIGSKIRSASPSNELQDSKRLIQSGDEPFFLGLDERKWADYQYFRTCWPQEPDTRRETLDILELLGAVYPGHLQNYLDFGRQPITNSIKDYINHYLVCDK